jgi:hypothetical protein
MALRDPSAARSGWEPGTAIRIGTPLIEDLKAKSGRFLTSSISIMLACDRRDHRSGKNQGGQRHASILGIFHL